MKAKHVFLGLACLLVTVLAGCGEKSGEEQSAAVAAKLTPVPHAAWLSRHLPAEAIAYLRIPTLWDMLSEPKEDALHPVQAGQTHVGQVAAIRKALLDNILSVLPEPAQLPAEMLLSQLQTPLEVAALKPGDGSFAPNVLIAAGVSFADLEGFSEWLARLTDSSPQLRVLTPTDADGYATVMAGPAPVYSHFNAREQRLLLLTGASASQPELTRYAGANAAENPLSGFEGGIDAAGRGPALWLDADRLYPMYQAMLPPEQTALFETSGLNQADFLWIGAASKGGKSSFKMHLQMPEVGFRKLLVRPDQVPGLNSAGAVDFALRLALPSTAEVGEALDYGLSLGVDGTAIREQLATGKGKLDEALGFDSGLLLEALGPEILVVSDRAGLWGGYQIRDQGALDKMLAAAQENTDTAIGSSRIQGVDIQHWALPTLLSRPEILQADGGIPEPWAAMLERFKTRLYWTREDNYLVMASVPQVLMARAQIGANQPIGDWLAGEMQLDWRHSVLAWARRVHHSPRDVYHGYINLLNFLADIVGAEIDPFAMPTWIDAGLPEYGRLGLRIDSGPQSLAVSLDYEYSPAEVLLGGGGGATGVAMLGIVAAIAIPAYQDYLMRAEIARALAAAGPLKIAVAKSYYGSGRFPDESEVQELLEWPAADDSLELAVDPDTGTIRMHFTGYGKPQMAGSSLYLEPVDQDGNLIWSCYSDEIQPKNLPASCRE